MTEIFRQKNRKLYQWMKAGTVICLVLFGASGELIAKGREKMRAVDITLWQAVDRLVERMPLSKERVEALFNTTLREKRRTANTLHLEGQDIELAQGSWISKIDLRLGFDYGDPGFAVLNIGGGCVTLDHVRERYADLKITGIPRGDSQDEETVHSTTTPWGVLSFGFSERDPNCLSSVILDPKK